jgi:hypothetical protein
MGVFGCSGTELRFKNRAPDPEMTGGWLVLPFSRPDHQLDGERGTAGADERHRGHHRSPVVYR